MKYVIIQGSLAHFRIELFNELASRDELSVIHSGNPFSQSYELNFDEIIVPLIKIGPFRHQIKLQSIITDINPDIIIVMMDVSYTHVLSPFFRKKFKGKTVWWGPWITNNRISNWIRFYLMKQDIPSVLYCNLHKDEFVLNNVPPENLFVANNTLALKNRTKAYLNKHKDYLLFVGSLNKRKGIDELISIFDSISNDIHKNIKLMIIGDGEQMTSLLRIIDLQYNHIRDRIIFKGAIYNENDLLEYFNRAIVSISTRQAGLSVLSSIGNGVPFITLESAISGGEKYNIIDDHNGYLCSDISTLKSRLKKCLCDISWSKKLGKNAYDYFSNHCNLEQMINAFNHASTKAKS